MAGETGDFLKPTEGKLSVKYSSATEVSLRHPEENQDVIGFDEKRGWAVVLDGVGGLKNGRLASQKGLKVIGEGLSKLRNFDTDKLQQIEDVLATAHKKIQETGGQTTMALVKMSDTIGKKKVIIYQIGDSRVYLLHEGKINRLTFDSAVSPQEKAMLDKLDVVDNPDDMTVEERMMFKTRNYTKTIGGKTFYSADYAMRILNKGDKIILTTDGVHDNLTTAEIEEAVRGEGDSAKVLVAHAKERSQDVDHLRSKPDDISAIVMEVE